MKKTLVKVILYLLLCNVLGCQMKQQKVLFKDIWQNETKIDSSKVNKLHFVGPIRNDDISLNPIIQNYKYIRLETNDSSIIGQINKLIYNDKYIFIGDFRQTKSVFVFSNNGKYLFKINKIGHGPEEFSYLDNFTINESNQEIILYVNGGGKLMIYDFHGNLKSQIILGFSGRNMEMLDTNIFIFDMGNNNLNREISNIESYNLLLVNNKGNIIQNYFRYNYENTKGYINEESLIKHNNEVYYNSSFDYNFYKIHKDSLQLEYSLSFAHYEAPQGYWANFFLNNNLLERNEKLKQIDYIKPFGYRVFGKYFLFTGSYKKRIYAFLFDTSNDKCDSGSFFSLKSGEKVKIPLGLGPISSYKNSIMCFIEPHEVIEPLPSAGKLLAQKEYNLFSSLKSSDNPVLIKCELK